MAHKLGKTVLVIDDEAIVRVTLARMLELAGYRVLQAANGFEGLKVFARAGISIWSFATSSPEKEGIETIGAIRCKNRSVKIIAMSGGGRMGSGETGRPVPCADAAHML